MDRLSLSLAFLLRIAPVAAVTPLEADILSVAGNRTTLNTQFAPSWSITSPVRSTANIIWTSAVTLFLCAYTVIHLNIPASGESHKKFNLRKCKWALIAILTPEYALWAAYEQWYMINWFRRELEPLLKSQQRKQQKGRERRHLRQLNFNPTYCCHTTSEVAERQTIMTNSFGRTYSYFAAMGGFVVDVSSIHDELTYVTITLAGLLFLAKNGHFITHPKKAIQDKSKADVLAKILVCLQVGWLAIQSVGRAGYGLPIALFEIHVLAHVACALLLYVLWFKKPLDIQEPTNIDWQTFGDELALMLQVSLCTGEQDQFNLYQQQMRDTGVDFRQSSRKIEAKLRGTALECNSRSRKRWLKASRAAMTKGSDCNGSSTPTATPCPDINPSLSFASKLDYLSLRAKNVHFSDPFASLSETNPPWRSCRRRHLMFLGSTLVIAAVYAGIHLTAWDYRFPTETEMWLWRGSSLLIAGIVPVTLFSSWIVNLLAGRKVSARFELLFLTFVYCSSRLFLFVECFISIRRMPIGVFVTLPWSNYIPHL
ncbi:hypothetical protein F4808DRAFT_465298 [Astrocystis sublimbata]|nr:hypothetical protein F4808DRAFT_465298 [Astrocystis sublimbata]